MAGPHHSPWTVVVRDGTPDACTWYRSDCTTFDYDVAAAEAARYGTVGRKALIMRENRLVALGLPEGWEPGLRNLECGSPRR